MNNSYYETLDENFTQALKLYEEEYTHDELINLLKSGNIVQKQIAALRLEGINSIQDADVLIANLTGQDGKIREAVSMRLNEFMSDEKYLPHFKVSNNYNVFLDAIIDINANICRNVISAITNLKNDSEFCEQFCKNLAKLSFKKWTKSKYVVSKIKSNSLIFKTANTKLIKKFLNYIGA